MTTPTDPPAQKTADLARSVAQDLRDRRFGVGTVGNDRTRHPDVVAVLRFGPDTVGAAHLLLAYLAEDNVTLEFDPARRTGDVDLVVGGQFRQLATPTAMRHRIAVLGRPALPPGTCRR